MVCRVLLKTSALFRNFLEKIENHPLIGLEHDKNLWSMSTILWQMAFFETKTKQNFIFTSNMTLEKQWFIAKRFSYRMVSRSENLLQVFQDTDQSSVPQVICLKLVETHFLTNEWTLNGLCFLTILPLL